MDVYNPCIDRGPCGDNWIGHVSRRNCPSGKPAGLVYVGAALRRREPIAEQHQFSGRPKQVLAAAIKAALQLGMRTIKEADAVHERG
jgi:nicotinamide mononucleotide (NMN) deamidase PncC